MTSNRIHSEHFQISKVNHLNEKKACNKFNFFSDFIMARLKSISLILVFLLPVLFICCCSIKKDNKATPDNVQAEPNNIPDTIADRMMKLYELNRDEITSISTNSIIMMIVSIVTALVMFQGERNGGKNNRPKNPPVWRHFLFAISLYAMTYAICFALFRTIHLGWLNWLLENELNFGKYGSEHIIFLKQNIAPRYMQLLAKIWDMSSFKAGSDTYFHQNLSTILAVSLMGSGITAYFGSRIISCKWIRTNKSACKFFIWFGLFVALTALSWWLFNRTCLNYSRAIFAM